MGTQENLETYDESTLIFCKPCYEHFEQHLREGNIIKPGESCDSMFEVKICPSNSEECLFEEDGCEGCGKSHARILSESIPDSPRVTVPS